MLLVCRQFCYAVKFVSLRHKLYQYGPNCLHVTTFCFFFQDENVINCIVVIVFNVAGVFIGSLV